MPINCRRVINKWLQAPLKPRCAMLHLIFGKQAKECRMSIPLRRPSRFLLSVETQKKLWRFLKVPRSDHALKHSSHSCNVRGTSLKLGQLVNFSGAWIEGVSVDVDCLNVVLRIAAAAGTSNDVLALYNRAQEDRSLR